MGLLKWATGRGPRSRTFAMELVILIGLQGSGKTSFYRSRFVATHAHVSKDNFRNNPRPARRQRQLLEEALGAGNSATVDNTNVTAADRAELITLARAFRATVTGYYFPPDLSRCLERNRLRVGKARVPDVALFATLKRMQPPLLAEGFDRLFTVRLVEGSGFDVRDWQEGTGDETR
jgi:predicted kinase